ncbi:MAG: hypothetical protein KDB07_03575, partial [Planctomycetes bacterium]|nr:hypothetical protein [Planctomycetota bacterium]
SIVANDVKQDFRERRARQSLLSHLERLRFDFSNDFLVARLNGHAGRVRGTQNLVVISDFLEEISPPIASSALSAKGRQLALICVLDQSELMPAGIGSGAMRLSSAEGHQPINLELGPECFAAYQRELASHLQAWGEAAHQRRALWATLNAAEGVPEVARRQLFAAEGAWL